MCVSSLAHRKDKNLKLPAGAEAGGTAAVRRPSFENYELRAHDREVMLAVLQSACASRYAPSLGALTLSIRVENAMRRATSGPRWASVALNL